MFDSRRVATALTGVLLLSSHVQTGPVLHPRDDDPLEQHLDMSKGGFPHGACSNNDFTNPDSRADIWFHSHGGDLVEYYLRNDGVKKHDNVDWAQDIYQILFDSNPGQMSCNGSQDSCTIDDKSCNGDFQEWPAAFYTFISLQNIHTFFAQYLERLTWMKETLGNEMEVLVHDFNVDGDSKETLNVWAIVAAALGMAGGITGESDLVSGVFNAFSGFANLIANINPGDSQLDQMGAVKSNLATIINSVTEGTLNAITAVQDQIYGHQGADESKIPKEMLAQDDYSSDYKHSTALVLGRGQWLMAHPVENLKSSFDEVTKQVKQTLALQLLRVFNKAYLVIHTDGVEDGCNKSENSAWDSDAGLCYSLVTINHKSLLGLDIETWSIGELGDATKPLWDKEKYGADKLLTFKNIIDCWVTNKGKMGTPSISITTPGTSIKQCFFSIEVKKGKLNTFAGGSGSTYLDLVDDNEFPNFSGEDKINHGGKPESCFVDPCSWWPMNHKL